MIAAAELEREGEGFRLWGKVPRRGTNFGTSELLEAIRATGRSVVAAHPDSTVIVANLSLQKGGKSRWHHSHQAGRDVDILLFAREGETRLQPSGFVDYGPDLAQEGRPGRSFDVERNLAVARALVEQDAAPVQWIFIADYLKEAMLREARRQGLEDDLMERLEGALHQPSDALPHADHFHVRVYCSHQDRLHGCLDVPPYWPWVERNDDAYAERVSQVLRLMDMSQAEWRKEGADYLALLRARGAVPRLVEGLEDPDTAVKRSCLAALRVVGSGEALDGLLMNLKTATSPRWALALFGALPFLRTGAIVEPALTMLQSPEELLTAEALADREGFQEVAARILRRRGRLESVPALVPLLSSDHPDLREEGERALQTITNHRFKRSVTSRRARDRKRAVRAWETLAEEIKGRPWTDVLVEGFRQQGTRLPSPLEGKVAVEALLPLLRKKERAQQINASRLLSAVTSHPVDAYHRRSRRLVRHWNRWWATDGPNWLRSVEFTGPPAEDSAESP